MNKSEKLDEVEKLVSSLEKNICRAEAVLKQASVIESVFSVVEEDIKKLKKLSYLEEYRDIMRKQIATRKIDEKFSVLIEELLVLKQGVINFDLRQEQMKEIFSKIKNSVEFEFSSYEKASEFAEDCFELMPSGKCFLAPLYLGLIDLSVIASALSLEKQGTSFAFSKTDFELLFSELEKKGTQSNFSVFNGNVKIDFLSSSTIKITAEPSKIKRIEILYHNK